MSTSISVPVLELGLRLSLYPIVVSRSASPELGAVMCDEGRAEDDCAGLKNLNNVCCRGSTVSGVGSGSDSPFSVPFSGSIQRSETGRCWAVNSQRSVFSSKTFLLTCWFHNLSSRIAVFNELTIYSVIIRTVIPEPLPCPAVKVLRCIIH